jgi:PKD repeat protein
MITVTATDSDFGEGSTSTEVSVNDITPAVGPVVAIGSPVDEGGTLELTGTFFDPGLLDTHTVVIEWSGGISRRRGVQEGKTTITTLGPNPVGAALTHDGIGNWTYRATHQYLDENPTDSSTDAYPIVVTVTDDDLAFNRNGTAVLVSNQEPVIDVGSIDVTIEPNAPSPGAVVFLAADFTDAGVLDIHDVIIDWGDGDFSDTNVSLSDAEFPVFDADGGGFGAFRARHEYAAPGTYQARITVIDDDHGTDTAIVPIVVPVNQPLDPDVVDPVDDLLWHNSANPFDVKGDGRITVSADAAPLLEELNQRTIIDPLGKLPLPSGAAAPPPYLDVSGDNRLTAVQDLLPLLNRINILGVAAEGEGASAIQLAAKTVTSGELDQDDALVVDASTIVAIPSIEQGVSENPRPVAGKQEQLFERSSGLEEGELPDSLLDLLAEDLLYNQK